MVTGKTRGEIVMNQSDRYRYFLAQGFSQQEAEEMVIEEQEWEQLEREIARKEQQEKDR